MCRASTVLFVTVLALAGSANAGPVMPFAPDRDVRAAEKPAQSHDGGLILVQRGGRAGGGGERYAGGANRGGFNSNDFHQNMSNSGNWNAAANRNVNVNANRNVYARGGGGCCYGNYNTGPSWGGVAAGVAAGAVVGAAVNSAASSPTYAAPPPTYPPGYVSPPPY